MINFIKRKYKLLIGILIGILLICYMAYYYVDNNKKEIVITKVEEKKEVLQEPAIISKIYVDIKGAIASPGVYEIEEGKRVIDVINAAGGLINDADTSNLNLGKKVKDEDYIIVYTKYELYTYKQKEEASCVKNECVCPDVNNVACIEQKTTTSDEKETAKVSLNTATKEELMTLNGIGESKAEAIISYRKENGNFESIEDLKNVSGIGDAMYEKIKDDITI